MPKIRDKDLHDVPEGEGLVCYKCKAVPAVRFKWMKTPTGGKYKRGWCNECLLGIPLQSREDITGDGGRPYKVGQEVGVAFTGTILHYIPKNENEVVVLVGTRGYTVALSHIVTEVAHGWKGAQLEPGADVPDEEEAAGA